MERFEESGVLGKYGNQAWSYPEFDAEEIRPKASRFCICVFVLNEGERLHSQLKKMAALADQVDIIIADGGSTDGSVSKEAVERFGIKTILVKRGHGRLGAQMRMAFAYALGQGYEGIIVVDGNDKDDVPGALHHFIDRLKQGFDHVQGSRYISGGHHANTPLSRYLGVKVLHSPLIRFASGYPYTDTTNGFRAYSAKLLKAEDVRVFQEHLSGYDLHYYLAIQAAQLGYKVCEVPVTRIYPKGGKVPTKISPLKGNVKLLGTLFSTVTSTSQRFKWMKFSAK